MKTISVKDVIRSNFCVSSEDGDKLYELIADSLANKNQISISFKDICVLTSAFLNNAIGRLCENYSDDDINKYVMFVDISEADQSLIVRVKKNARKFYSNIKDYTLIYEQSISD